MPTAEQTRCHCGTPMLLTPSEAGHYCPNCDVVQRAEVLGFARRKTKEDIRYQAYWEVEKTKYTDNTVPDADEDKE